MEGIRRPVFGGLTAAGSVGALIAGLAVIDPRVRDEIASLFSQGSSGELVETGTRVKEIVSVLLLAVRDQSIEHAPLVIFTLAALVLVTFMLRT